MYNKEQITQNRPFAICPNEELASFLIKHGLIRSGSIKQCEKIFDLNDRSKMPNHLADISEIITAIWLCSDQDRRSIADMILGLKDQYIERLIEKAKGAVSGVAV